MDAQRICKAVAVLSALSAASPAAADFIELQRLIEAPAASIAEKIGGAPVVVVVCNGSEKANPWNIGQAAGIEITAALRRRHINAIRAAADPRFQDLESSGRGFTARQTKALKPTDRQILVAIEWIPGKKPRIKISAFAIASSKPVWNASVDVPEDAMSLAKNIPPLNRAVVEFARKALGSTVRDGDCTQLAEDGLKAAGAEKRGIYRWGRELGPREPWLPGDILQMERVTVKLPGTTRIFDHHTAVVDEVHGEAIVALHQNGLPDGKVVQREVWPAAGIDGQVVAFRPWDWPDDNPYPPASPLRVSPLLDWSERKIKKPKLVDLLKLIEPRLDHVQGIWFFEKDGALRSPKEFEARIEVPVAPPRSYSLRMTVERLQGTQQLGIGIVVGGRQTMISIDNSGGRFTGFHNLDDKPASDNESTKEGEFLRRLQPAELECRVRENEVQLDIDKAEIIRWRGDPARLSVSPDWAMPHAEWLFLSAFDSEFDISSFMLAPLFGDRDIR
jgi:hypothetical protein